jgi:hypothetical protein
MDPVSIDPVSIDPVSILAVSVSESVTSLAAVGSASVVVVVVVVVRRVVVVVDRVTPEAHSSGVKPRQDPNGSWQPQPHHGYERGERVSQIQQDRRQKKEQPTSPEIPPSSWQNPPCEQQMFAGQLVFWKSIPQRCPTITSAAQPTKITHHQQNQKKKKRRKSRNPHFPYPT